jgi:hypothetical protein
MLPPAERQPEKKATRMDAPAVASIVKPKAAEHIEFRMPLLAAHAAVQRELNLNAEQVAKIRGVLREVEERGIKEQRAAKPPQAWPGQPADPNVRLLQAKHRALRDTLPDILTVPQARRLRQLERQRAGYGAFLEPDNQELLRFTDEQREKLKVIVADLNAKAPGSRPPARDESPKEVHNDTHDAEVEAYRKAVKAATEQILQLLTANQATIWRDLVGEPVELRSLDTSELFILLPPPPRGAPGQAITQHSGNADNR